MTDSLRKKLSSFDPNLPLEQARTIPSTWYFDPEIYEAECSSIFSKSWQCVGRVDQLTEGGAFFTLELASEPILILRDQERKLRAFHNVCRHRAAPVIEEACGIVSKLRCKYHGWTYDLAGKLRGTPEFEGVAGFCKEEQGLPELDIDTWGPLVWVRQRIEGKDGSVPCSLAEFLSPLPERAADLGLQSLRFAERRTYDLECNWKVYVDNYLDGGYHINTIHPALAGVLDYSQYRTEVAGNTSVQISPLRPVDPKSDGASVGKVRAGDYAYYWWLFPNFMINIYQGLMDTNLVLPLGPNRCRVIFDFYFDDVDGPDAANFIAESIAVADQVQIEDSRICEQVQRGLKSKSFNTGRFSVRREIAGYYFHQMLSRDLSKV